MAETLKKRSEIPENLKWDLSLIYENDDAMYRDLEKVVKMADEIEQEFSSDPAYVALLRAERKSQ